MLREALAAVAGCLALTAADPSRAAQDLSGLDLRLEPADVAPSPPPPFRSVTDAPSSDELETNDVATLDQAPQTETPNRRKTSAGSLETIAGDEDLLRQLLENKTIPLFRIRVEPPF